MLSGKSAIAQVSGPNGFRGEPTSSVTVISRVYLSTMAGAAGTRKIRQTQWQRPMPYLEKEINKLALKVALAALSISAFAGHPVKEDSGEGGSRVAPSHRVGSNPSVADNDGKRGGVASPASKEGVHSNPSGKPIQVDTIRPGAGSYNRDLLR
ncbi:MAG: hypothetical protein ABI270_11295 [Nitrosospira sp.]